MIDTHHDPFTGAVLAGGDNRWPRYRLAGAAEWCAVAAALARGEGDLVALFADRDAVHMAVRGMLVFGGAAIVTLPVTDGTFPSVGAIHAPAMRLERTICDLYGLTPTSAPDARAWLDHGVWPFAAPLSSAPGTAEPRVYTFLPVEGEGLHQIPVGPVHAGIIEPGHFRFTANGEIVVRLEERLGYVHKGVEALATGCSIEAGARLAGRISGDSTVAYALAYAHAVESALRIEVPRRAVLLRAVFAELERLANHFGDIGAVCNDAAFAMMLAHCSLLRESVLSAADAATGHRLMMDAVVPGGVATDVAPEAVRRAQALVDELEHRFGAIVELYDSTPSLLDRTVTTGIVRADDVRRFGAGGYVGRACGRRFDARRNHPYAPYDVIEPRDVAREEGDVDARLWVRIDEVRDSLRLIRVFLADLSPGPVRNAVTTPGVEREGIGIVEAFRGDVFVFVRLAADGTIAWLHARDPSWFQWPLLEAAIEDNIVADFPLINKSFNCSYSGHDL